MSNFQCEHCGSACCDSPKGYITGCEHYPPEIKYNIAVYRLNGVYVFSLGNPDMFQPTKEYPLKDSDKILEVCSTKYFSSVTVGVTDDLTEIEEQNLKFIWSRFKVNR